ncbi:major facilitator superfamily domain-containing protein [Boletus edulis BED1]|uniref:Major facilitator superfamily domain-containing protein n=1 Tax=Boletus edulis BED1 TaxID=1328754 RepID=A0AAD4BHD2_BOLED|nr:major facilitator superfamily domain-containing protein [Boletus edulis BED1]
MLSSLRDSGPSEHISAPSKSDGDNTLSSSPHTVEDSGFPEGGMVAWCTVFGVFLAQFCGFGYTSAFGVYQAFYAQHYLQTSSPSAVSWIGSLATFLVTAVGPICGPLFDNGYFYHVYITGAVLQSFSLFMLSLVQPGQYYQVLLAQGLVSGIAQGLMYVPSFAVLSHHFKRRRATMMSIVSSGVSLGGIANTIMLNQLLNGPIGFKMGVQISATFITVLLIISCILVRPRYSAVRQEEVSVNSWKATKKCFTEVPSLLSIIGFMLFQVTYMYPFFYFQVDSLRHGLSATFAFYALVVINAGSFVARFVASAVLPYVGVIDLTIITIVACAILIIGMIWLGSAASVIVLGILYGLFSGINVAIMAPVLGLMSDPAEFGVRLGVGFAITGFGALVGPPICGALLTDRYLWWAPAFFCGVIALAGGVLFVGVRFSFVRAGAGAAHTGAGDEQQIETGSHDEKKEAKSTRELYPSIPGPPKKHLR